MNEALAIVEEEIPDQYEEDAATDAILSECLDPPDPIYVPAEQQDLSGAGAAVEVVDIVEPRVATITHDGSSNFSVKSLDASGESIDLLVNEIGAYTGTVPLAFAEGESIAAFEIEADGAWAITIKDVSEARRWDGTGTLAGETDDVILTLDVFQGLSPVTVIYDGDSNFVIRSYTDQIHLVVNEIGPYRGEVSIPSGSSLLEVGAVGAWSITRS